MIGGSNTQRQKMINLMYIVFIALLGLGVHKQKESKAEIEAPAPTVHIAPQDTDKESTDLQLLTYPPESLSAIVTPNSKQIALGDTYSADIRLSPNFGSIEGDAVIIAEQKLGSNRYEVRPTSVGTHRYSGRVELSHRGQTYSYPFEGEYTVTAPQLSLSNSLTNILYAGIDNPIKLNASGYPRESLSLRVEGGSLRHEQEAWLVKPNAGIKELSLSVYARSEKGERIVGTEKLRVRPLPPPSPYISLGATRFRGGRIARADLLSAGGVSAGIDDGILDIEYKVVGFSLIAFDELGNAIPEVSEGGRFSARQIRQIQTATRGKRLFVTELRARGADGVEHRLPSLELVIN